VDQGRRSHMPAIYRTYIDGTEPQWGREREREPILFSRLNQREVSIDATMFVIVLTAYTQGPCHCIESELLVRSEAWFLVMLVPSFLHATDSDKLHGRHLCDDDGEQREISGPGTRGQNRTEAPFDGPEMFFCTPTYTIIIQLYGWFTL
jgi:hypothetical protein